MSQKHHVNWIKSIPFIGIHFVAIIGAFLVPFSWKMVALCTGSYLVRMFAITAGYHRYFSHRTFKLGRIPQFLMALLGTCAVQKGVLWWAANHRHHHRFSDKPEDIHSPAQGGFWWAHVNWILVDAYEETRWDLVGDLMKYPELVFLNRWHLPIVVVFAASFYFIGGTSALIWGFFVSSVLLLHGTFTINSLSHVFGTQRYDTGDTSRNNFWLALITLGEGWHNNHHCYMNSVRQGFYWWEIDASYFIVKILSFVGIARELKNPPMERLKAREINRISVV